MRLLQMSHSNQHLSCASHSMDVKRLHWRWRWRGPGVPRTHAIQVNTLPKARVYQEFDRGSG